MSLVDSKHQILNTGLTQHSAFLPSMESAAALRRTGWQQTAFSVFLNLFTASQIPYAISTMGWTWGIIIYTLMVTSNWWGGHMLIKSCVRADAYSWRDLGHAAFGYHGGLVVDYLQTIGIVLMGMLQTQNAGGYWGQAFPMVESVCSWWWILINALPLLIFFQIPSFGGTNVMKYATGLTVVCVLWRMALYLALMGYYGKYPYTCYGGQSTTSIFTGTCNMIYTFSVTNVLPEMMREMTKPQEMHRSWDLANYVAMPLFTLFGFWGFYLYGVFNQQATFSVQFQADNTNLLVYNIFALIGNLLPSVYNQLAVFMKVELSLGVMPTDWWTITSPEWARFPRIPPVVFRFVFRSCVLAVYVFVAEGLLSDGIGNIQGLIGAVAVAAFSFYLPWVIHWRIFRYEITPFTKIVCAFFFTLGVGAAIGGAIASGASMADMSGGFMVFPDDICSANAFYMGKFGGGGVDNPEDNGAFSKATGPGTFHDTFYTQTCLGPSVRLECAQPDVHCCAWDDDKGGVVCAPQAAHSLAAGNMSSMHAFLA